MLISWRRSLFIRSDVRVSEVSDECLLIGLVISKFLIPIVLLQMEGKYLQTSVARPSGLPHYLLCDQHGVSLCPQRRPKNVSLILILIWTFNQILLLQYIWSYCAVLRQLQWPDPPVLRSGLLRVHRDDPMVEPVHLHSLARPHRRVCQLQCPRPGRTRPRDAPHNHALRLPLPHHGPGQCVAEGEEALPRTEQPCRSRSAQRQRAGHHRDHEQGLPEAFEALAAHRLGRQHHHKSQERGSHPRRLRREDDHRRAEQVPGTVRLAHQLRHNQRAPGVHPGGHPSCVLLLPDLLHGQAVDRRQDGGQHLHLEQGGSVLPGVHHTAVLLLHGMAQGGRVSDQSVWRGRWRFWGRYPTMRS